MLKLLAHWMTRFMWNRITDPKLLRTPVNLKWYKADGTVKYRVGVWHDARSYDGIDYGPGFVCWFSDRPLADTMTHWAPLLLVPR